MVTHIDGCNLSKQEIESIFASVARSAFKIEWSNSDKGLFVFNDSAVLENDLIIILDVRSSPDPTNSPH
jgi:hypothetical protein